MGFDASNLEWFVFPPRPTQSANKFQLNYFEKNGFEAQVKKSGICIVMASEGYLTRHAYSPEAKWASDWKPSYALRQTLPEGCTIAAELMRDGRVFIWDVLRFEGEFTAELTWGARRVILHSIPGIANCLLETRRRGFRAWFDSLDLEDEGLVLRLPSGKWKERGWMYKVVRRGG